MFGIPFVEDYSFVDIFEFFQNARKSQIKAINWFYEFH
jgi:hypothetical protein